MVTRPVASLLKHRSALLDTNIPDSVISATHRRVFPARNQTTVKLGYFSMITDMQKPLCDLIAAAHVLDIGSGRCKLADWMTNTKEPERAPKSVTCIDRQNMVPDQIPKGVSFIGGYYLDLLGSDKLRAHYDVGIVSWPSNANADAMKGIIDLTLRCSSLVVVSCGVDMTACGNFEFWDHLTLHRPLELEIAHADNSMLIYGRLQYSCNRLGGPRCIEEAAGLAPDRVFWFNNYENRILQWKNSTQL